LNPPPPIDPLVYPRQIPKVVVPSYIGDAGCVLNAIPYLGTGDTLHDWSGSGNHGKLGAGDPDKMPMWVDGSYGWSLCIPPDSMIISNPEIKPISELESGDVVLGDSGNFERVITPIRREYEGEMVRLQPYHFPAAKMTPEHRVKVIRTEYCHSRMGVMKDNEGRVCPLGGCRYRNESWCRALYKNYKEEWVKAGELEKKDYVVLSFPNKSSDIESINVEEIINEDIIVENDFVYPVEKHHISGTIFKNPYANGIPEQLPINEDFLRFVGYYLAEGHADKGRISLSFGRDEEKYISDAARIGEEIFNLPVHIKEKETATSVEIYNAIISRLFSKLFGSTADKKKLPTSFLYLLIEKQKSLLEGYLRGDGSFEAKEKRVRWNSVSPTLSYQIALLIMRQGIIPSFRVIEKENYNILGNEGKSKKQYEGTIHTLNPFSNVNFNPRGRRGIIVNGKCYLPIFKLDRERYSGEVYNLEVEGHHSYNLFGMTVHNSFDGMNDYVDCGDGASLQIGPDTDFTYEAWVKPTDEAKTWSFVMGGANLANYSLYMWKSSTERFPWFYLSYYEGTVSRYLFGATWAINQWHHLVLNRSGDTFKMYQDGVLTGTYTYNTGTSLSHLYIGRSGDADRTGKGLIALVRIYSRALSADEVKMHFEDTRSIFGV
jgi:hypothetical protein